LHTRTDLSPAGQEAAEHGTVYLACVLNNEYCIAAICLQFDYPATLVHDDGTALRQCLVLPGIHAVLRA
jgi:hypothetical protein